MVLSWHIVCFICSIWQLSATAVELELAPRSRWEGSKLIWYNSSNFDDYVTTLDYFLQGYKSKGSNVVKCAYGESVQPDKVCEVDLQDMCPCTSNNSYGYNTKFPCIFLRLKHNKEWKPHFYKNSTSLPFYMPHDLQQHITHIMETAPDKMRTVWVSCSGIRPVDMEFISSVNYLPNRGFPGYYFANTSNRRYPLVAVHLNGLTQDGVLINIECKAWAQNIKQDEAVVQFVLLHDN